MSWLEMGLRWGVEERNITCWPRYRVLIGREEWSHLCCMSRNPWIHRGPTRRLGYLYLGVLRISWTPPSSPPSYGSIIFDGYFRVSSDITIFSVPWSQSYICLSISGLFYSPDAEQLVNDLGSALILRSILAFEEGFFYSPFCCIPQKEKYELTAHQNG